MRQGGGGFQDQDGSEAKRVIMSLVNDAGTSWRASYAAGRTGTLARVEAALGKRSPMGTEHVPTDAKKFDVMQRRSTVLDAGSTLSPRVIPNVDASLHQISLPG